MIAKGDVANEKDVQRIFSAMKKSMPPLKGLQHAAMVLDDGSIPEMTPERYMSVFKPKAIGCWHLHKATRSMALDHFICLHRAVFSRRVGANPRRHDITRA